MQNEAPYCYKGLVPGARRARRGSKIKLAAV